MHSTLRRPPQRGRRLTASHSLCGRLRASHTDRQKDDALNGRRRVNAAWLCTKVTLFCNCHFFSFFLFFSPLAAGYQGRSDNVNRWLMKTTLDRRHANKAQMLQFVFILIRTWPLSSLDCKLVICSDSWQCVCVCVWVGVCLFSIFRPVSI